MNVITYKTPGSARDWLLNEECWKDAADCGFNVFLVGGQNIDFCANGEEAWEDSKAKKCFDIARKIGGVKLLLRDWRLYHELYILGDKLLGKAEDCRFHTEEELDAYVRYCVKDYINDSILYGIAMIDEPGYSSVKVCGHIYRSIERVAKEFGREEIYIQLNLLPMAIGAYQCLAAEGYQTRRETDIYEEYIEAYLTELKPKTIWVDNYPFRPSKEGGLFLPGYYTCFQILQRQCKKHGVNQGFILQSFEMYNKTKPDARIAYRRVQNIYEMFLQMNSALAFGVKEVAFYTYTTEIDCTYRIEDGSSFVTSKGEKTNIWYYGKAAIAHAQALAPVLKEYDYERAHISLHKDLETFKNNYLGSEGIYLGADENGADIVTEPSGLFENAEEFTLLKNFTHDKEVLLVTELKKQNEEAYLYTVQNIVDTPYKRTLGPMRVKLEFADCTKAKIFRDEQWIEVNMEKGIYEWTLMQGEAIFIIPIKE